MAVSWAVRRVAEGGLEQRASTGVGGIFENQKMVNWRGAREWAPVKGRDPRRRKLIGRTMHKTCMRP